MVARDLDLPPTFPQGALLRILANGRDLVLEDGRPTVAQTGEKLSWGTVNAVVARQWVSGPPGLPLFDGPVTLTDRGRAALDRLYP